MREMLSSVGKASAPPHAALLSSRPAATATARTTAARHLRGRRTDIPGVPVPTAAAVACHLRRRHRRRRRPYSHRHRLPHHPHSPWQPPYGIQADKKQKDT